MKIDIKPILKGDTDYIDISYLLKEAEGMKDIVFSKPFNVEGNVKNSAGYITLFLQADVPYETHCARCYKELEGDIKVDFSRVVAEKNSLQDDENDDYVIAENGYLDIDELLIEQVLLELPTKILCKEDCKGLCPKCGTDLNENSCSCETKEPDPRFDVLRKLLENK